MNVAFLLWNEHVHYPATREMARAFDLDIEDAKDIFHNPRAGCRWWEFWRIGLFPRPTDIAREIDSFLARQGK
jgi:hypothetical protein